MYCQYIEIQFLFAHLFCILVSCNLAKLTYQFQQALFYFILFFRFYRIFYVYAIMSSVYKDSLNSPFPIWVPSISFYCFVIITSNTILNRSDDSEYSFLVTNLKQKAFGLLQLGLILAVHFKQMYSISFMKFSSVPALFYVPEFSFSQQMFVCARKNVYSIFVMPIKSILLIMLVKSSI